ncbi:MAG: FAD synthase [Methanomassiliicoccaceae archaeon]|nr:FAD synthase [Methanomassiliicoccaceae archaeon]
MVRVMASGVFDILHTGHISYLEQAKAMGDELIVVVACDHTVRKRKHEPITPEKMRAEIINSLKPVDRTVIGHESDMYSTIEEIRPDIIVLGFDQTFNEDELRTELKKRGMSTEIRRATRYSEDLTGTRKIIEEIVKKFGGDNE